MEHEPVGIWPPHQAFYIQSMLFNSTSAVRSIARLNHTFEKLPSPPTMEDISRLPTTVILNELQNMVLQAAALSRYFWSVRPKVEEHASRAAALRDAFGIDESNPLVDRNLRNALEHFDERLDKYLSSGIVGYVFPQFVGLRPIEEGVPGHFFRAYFANEGTFRLLDEEFAIEPLANALHNLHEQLDKMDKNGGMFRYTKAGA